MRSTFAAAAPAIKHDRHAGFDLDRFGRQQLNDDLKFAQVPDGQQRRSCGDHALAWIDDAQNAPGDRRAHAEEGASVIARRDQS
jgi:hypothetical protein